MALKQGSERFTKWTHTENGKVLTRRLHRMEVQARDGRLYVIKGDDLPDALQTNCGHAYKGEHLAQILLNPSKINTRGYELGSLGPWPNGRDALNFAIGFLAIAVLRFVVTLQFGQ
jgi:hypothetical protein